MSRVPRIRFKGFEEDWEQRKLGELADIIGGGTPSTLNLDYWDGNIDWYSPAEIIDQIYVDRSQRKITELGFEKSSAKMLPEGTVLFTSRAGIGKTAILAKKGCTNQGFQSIVPHSNKLDSYFIFSRTEELKKYGELVGAGSTFVEVSGRQMENMQLMIPKTIGEQHIIGVLFSTIDHLITLHQRKLEKLKIIKKSMLENLFPQNGEKTPKIRFSGFTEDWEQRKLGEIGSVAMCRRVFKYQTTESGDIPFFKIGSFGATPDAFIPKDLFEKLKMKYPYPEKGDVLISASGSIGRTVVFTGKDEYFQDSNIVWLKHDNSIINHFLKYLYSIVKWVGIEGTTIKRLYNDNILKTEVIIPTLSEQQKVSNYLDGLDHIITLHQSKLEKLQKIKKSMLESMFV